MLCFSLASCVYLKHAKKIKPKTLFPTCILKFRIIMATEGKLNRLFNKIKEKRDSSKVLKYIVNKYIITLIIFLAIVLFIDKNNVIRWGEDYIQQFRQEKIIEKYRKDIENLDERINELSSNRDSLEKFAREQYYFHESDEDIFIVKQK